MSVFRAMGQGKNAGEGSGGAFPAFIGIQSRCGVLAAPLKCWEEWLCGVW